MLLLHTTPLHTDAHVFDPISELYVRRALQPVPVFTACKALFWNGLRQLSSLTKTATSGSFLSFNVIRESKRDWG